MKKEEFIKTLKNYFNERIDNDLESFFEGHFEVIDALRILKKITNEEWELLYDKMFELVDFVIKTLVEYPFFLNKEN